MADYIEREAAIEVIDKIIRSGSLGINTLARWVLEQAIKAVKCLPAADVTPVVKCEECDHWNAETHGCTRNPSLAPWWETDFCNYGE